MVMVHVNELQNKTTTEDQMEVLYESLQAEAKKIQQFKVHALAQIKQKVLHKSILLCLVTNHT